ncbi:hypothetical protein [Sinorhizobium fredii]|uniref:hypothetical protein n=1 Tax=Rhizobium fredii TaxID=380 RepID=UPI0013047C20|nr:hypothetical protein [Sinorhizobium fredii]
MTRKLELLPSGSSQSADYPRPHDRKTEPGCICIPRHHQFYSRTLVLTSLGVQQDIVDRDNQLYGNAMHGGNAGTKKFPVYDKVERH